MKRRGFLQSVAAGSLAAAASAAAALPRRKYRDGVELSIIGFGGVVVVGMEQAAADRAVAASFDRGVNYYDVAPSYWDGEAETKLGIALQPYRDKVFLACKTTQREAAGAQAELDRSLQRLKTDHFDLYQFHAVTTTEDVERIFAPGGAAETFRRAREQGKVRFLGCSAHSEEAAIAVMDRIRLDSILFPFNYVTWAHGFGPRVMEHAKKKGVARLAIKAMALKPWPKDADRKGHPKTWYVPVDDPQMAEQALRFTLSEDVTAAIPPGEEPAYELALKVASRFKPMSSGERKKLLASAADVEPLFKAQG